TAAYGVLRLKDTPLTTYSLAEGLIDKSVRSVATAEDGVVVANRYALMAFEDGRFRTLALPQPTPASIHPLLTDRNGRLWMGTPQGLLDPAVHAIVDDGRGSLWMGGVEGISQVDKREMDDLAAGRARAVAPRLYGTSDGMRAKTCAGNAQPGATRTKDGRIWF